MQEQKFQEIPKPSKAVGCLVVGGIVIILAILNDFRKSGHFFALMPLIGVLFWGFVAYIVWKKFIKPKPYVSPKSPPPSKEVSELPIC